MTLGKVSSELASPALQELFVRKKQLKDDGELHSDLTIEMPFENTDGDYDGAFTLCTDLQHRLFKQASGIVTESTPQISKGAYSATLLITDEGLKKLKFLHGNHSGTFSDPHVTETHAAHAFETDFRNRVLEIYEDLLRDLTQDTLADEKPLALPPAPIGTIRVFFTTNDLLHETQL